jgi:hypothetical protein
MRYNDDDETAMYANFLLLAWKELTVGNIQEWDFVVFRVGFQYSQPEIQLLLGKGGVRTTISIHGHVLRQLIPTRVQPVNCHLRISIDTTLVGTNVTSFAASYDMSIDASLVITIA